MNDIFNFAEAMQKSNSIKRPSLSEVIEQASSLYDKFSNYVTISKEEYMKTVVSDYENSLTMDSDTYFAHTEFRNKRSKELLIGLQSSIDKKIQEVRKEKAIRESKKLKNRIKSFLKRTFKIK